MSSTLIESRRNGIDKNRMTEQRLRFCDFLLADPAMNGTEAARKVGLKNPSQYAVKLLKNPQVRAYLGKEKRLRQERTRKTADDVLRFLENAVFLNPAKFFTPGNGGGWLVNKKDWNKIPDEIGCLIEEVQEQVEVKEDRTITRYWIKLVSKTKMVEMLAKHHGIFERDNDQQKGKYVLDLSALYSRKIVEDPVEYLIQNPEPPRELPKVGYRVDELLGDDE